jgi:hypothetical protein
VRRHHHDWNVGSYDPERSHEVSALIAELVTIEKNCVDWIAEEQLNRGV